MRLVNAHIRKFRNVLDSSVTIEPDVTCLVGKNGSGKTAFLHALHRLLPAEEEVSFDIQSHYPAWIEKRDRMQGVDREEVSPIRATFKLEEEEVQQIEERFGPDTVNSQEVGLERTYGGDLRYELDVDEHAFVNYVVDQIDWPYGTKSDANEVKTVEQLRAYAGDLAEESSESSSDEGNEEERRQEAHNKITEELDRRLGGHDKLRDAVLNLVEPLFPKFLYFDEYSRLPYSVDIEHVLNSSTGQLNRAELTARSLLNLGGADEEYLTNPDYERRKRELETVANLLTEDMREYWTQNPELRVQPDITMEKKSAGGNRGQQAVIDKLKLRIWDNRHSLSLRFDEHSNGFRWFFSFLAAFSKYEHTKEPLVILLDEPALGLHAKAQEDFLRYIVDRLAPRCQVIYTTHSPFMVQPGNLDRVRLLEDKMGTDDGEEGAVITSDVTSTDEDTLFPLQGALGYDLAQNLFIGPHNLVVEGTSDYTYLTVISDFLEDQEEDWTTLDERWSIVPVGGASQVPSFVALLGSHLDVAVVVDAQQEGHQRLSHLADQGLLEENRLLTIGGVIDQNEADIEDLFVERDYLDLYNRTFETDVSPSDLQGEDPIVRRLARNEGVSHFDHGAPADELLRYRDEVLPEISNETLQRFEALFEAINGTIET